MYELSPIQEKSNQESEENDDEPCRFSDWTNFGFDLRIIFILEEGFMSCTAAHHQGAIRTFWLQFWRDLWSSISSYTAC